MKRNKVNFIADNVVGLIGRTPLVRLDRIVEGYDTLYGKPEYMNPGGSIKDRAAFRIIRDAYQNGYLRKGQEVVEMTSGNMGTGLAIVCRYYGNPFTAVMPRGNSPERSRMLRALGADIILAEQADGEPGKVTGADIDNAISLAREIAMKKGAFYVDQFNNYSSVRAHMLTTGPEIAHALPAPVVFIAAVGSGGTFIGTSRYLKSIDPRNRCIAVEPEGAAILKSGKVINPRHIIQGTGYSRVPPHWDEQLADQIITVTDKEVISMTQKLASIQGIYAGYSSGANVAAAEKYIRESGTKERIVVILCDTGYKYSLL